MTWKEPDITNHRMNPEICDGFICYIPDVNGEVVFWYQHENIMEKMRSRIAYLENCCDEYFRQLTD